MYNGPIIVSACLLGLRTRYDGKDAYSIEAVTSLEGRMVIPVCPEQLGGLPTPRPASQIIDGDGAAVLAGTAKVIDEFGADVTLQFMKGAMDVLQIAKLTDAEEAFLKERSPSCGVGTICRDSLCINGTGVTASLLKREGLTVRGF